MEVSGGRPEKRIKSRHTTGSAWMMLKELDASENTGALKRAAVRVNVCMSE
jgi:hypothetical protein